jgi:asparagine synthase (glutamine-hydrolysing)
MCGITGLLNFDKKPINSESLRKMTHALKHRGPDGQGFHIEDFIGIGHQRLSIIDLEGGRQPLSNESDTIWITFNGEIYNYKELRQQLQSKGHHFKTNSDTETIVHAYEVQYIPSPHSIYEEVKKLKPGHLMFVTFDGKTKEQEKYWDVNFEPNTRLNEDEFLEQFEDNFIDSIKHHIVSDVEYGAFLSGGVDSSAVVAYMTKVLNKSIKTFTIGFEEEEYNELEFAKEVSQRFHSDHTFKIVKPDAIEVLPQLVKHYGEPFGDSSAIPTYYVSQLASESVPMILSGDGADEAFGGYDSYRNWMNWLNLSTLPQWKRTLRPIVKAIFPRYVSERKPTLSSWLNIISYNRYEARRNLWKEEYHSNMNQIPPIFNEYYEKAKNLNSNHKVQYMDIKTYLPEAILTKVDRASMMHSLEVRTPITDAKMFEFAASIPNEMNFRKNQNGQYEGKLLFKKMLYKHFPKEFLHRRKKGFAVPLNKWFAESGHLHNHINERVLDRNSNILKYFNRDAVNGIIQNNVTGSIWLLLFLEEWFHQNN